MDMHVHNNATKRENVFPDLRRMKLPLDLMDLLNTEAIDIVIENARNKKKTIDSKMDFVMSFMREVELREEAAEKVKQGVDKFSLDVLAEIDELVLRQQHVKEANDKRARELYAHKADLVTEMKELQFRMLGVLNEGDGCIATIIEMSKSLEKRLTAAVIQKETKENEKLEKEATLAYHKSQMEKLVEESKRLEQEAMETLKLQEFLIDRGHILNMLIEEISRKCQDVNLLKMELDNYHNENEILVTEDYLRPIVQEMSQMKDYDCYKCGNMEEMKTNKIIDPWIDDSDLIQEVTYAYMDQLIEGKQARSEPDLKHAYHNSEIEKLAEGSKRVEQQTMENVKVNLFMEEELEAYLVEIDKLVLGNY